MRRFNSLFNFELKLFVHNFINMFFILVFPAAMLLLFGSIYGNSPSALFHGYGTIDFAVPSYICLIIGVTGLMSLPITLCTYREKKVLKRLRATPLKGVEVLGVHFAVNFFMTIIGIGLLILLAILVYDITLRNSLLYIFLTILLIIISIFSIGTLIASIFNTAKTAIGVANLVYFPMIFLSGATVPIEIMPKTMQNIAYVLPMTHAVKVLKGVFFNQPLEEYGLSLGVLVLVSIIAISLSVRYFRWE